MGGLTKPKGGSTVQTVKEMPGYVTDAQQGLYGAAQSMTSPFLQTPTYATAGLNADQLGGFDLTRAVAESAFTSPKAAVPAQTGYAPRIAGNAATTGGPAQVTGGAIKSLMDPYTQSVLDPALANLRRQSDINAAEIGAQSAASSAYGGSREAIRQAQNTRALGEQTAQLVPQLYSSAFGKAAELAGQNAQMRNQDAQFNAGAANTMAQYNSGVINDAARFGITNGMQAAQMQEALDTSRQQRQLQAIQALLGIGGQQQQLLQTGLDTPFTMLQRYGGTITKDTGSTTTAPNTANSPLQDLFAAAVSLGGKALGGK